jgi:phosphoribosylformylglycinamidine (FGAM) synthase-like amidotransferase family enzyme
LANRFRYKLGDALRKFVGDEKLAIGICNGFQVLVKMGLLPGSDAGFTQNVTITHNDSSRFEDRWTHLAVDPNTPCVWLNGITQVEVPVRHGEGKFIPRDEGVLSALRDGGQLAVRYALSDGTPAQGHYPENPNGSTDDVAGLCDASGRIFGLMPHPEAFLHRENHPRWTREALPEDGAGLAMFRNAVRHAEKTLL